MEKITKQEIIQDLINRAEQLSSIEISKKNLIKVNLLDFANSPGEEIYYFDEYLYKKSEKDKSKWLQTKVELPKEETEEETLESKIKKLQECISDSITWCNNFKKYVDKKVKEIEDNQEETLKQVKEYIDNKTKGGKI